MSFEAGSIYYTIKADTGALLTADKEVSSFNRRAQEGFEKTGASMSKLTTIAKAVSAALVSNTVIAYAQSWNELEDRIHNTGATASQTKDILDQLLATSDRNGRTIEESSELYIRLSNSMSELGYSTQSTLSYIDTLSNLLTIDKTKALGAESAINALTKAQIKGKLAGLEAMSVFGAMPTVLKILGKQLNKTEAEVQKMAMDGKLSMSQFTNAMIEAQEETAALADNMRNNIQDGLNRIANNAKRYLGELNNSTGATKTLVDALILMSEHIDILMTSVGVLAAIYAGKYITSLANATKQSVEKTIADMRQAQAEKVLLQAEVERASQNVKALQIQRQNIIIAQAHCNNLKAQTALNKQLEVVEKQLAVATNEQAAAQARLDKAIKATSFSARGLQAAMAMLGGPAGMLLLAAGALTTWASNANAAREAAINFKDKVDDLRESLKSLTYAQLIKQQADYMHSLQIATTELSKQEKKLKDFEQRLAKENTIEDKGDGTKKLIEGLESQIKRFRSEVDTTKQSISNIQQVMNFINTLLIKTGENTDNAAKKTKSLDEALEQVGKNKIDEKVKSLSTELEIADMKLKDSKRAAYIYENVLNDLGAAGEEYKATLRGLIEGTKKWEEVSEEASEDVRKVLAPLFKLYGDLFDKKEQLSASNKKGRSTTKSYAEETKKLKDELQLLQQSYSTSSAEAQIFRLEQETNTKIIGKEREKLEELFNLMDGYKTIDQLKNPLQFEENSFNNAKTALNDWFTKNPDKYSDYYSKLEKLEKQHQINLAKIKSDAVVSDIDNAVAQVDPVLALENEHKRKLALIQEFETQKWTSEQNAIALREAANRQFEQNRINAQWEIWRNQSDANEFLASSLEGLASSATSTISGLMSGTMTATQAMQNFANVILNEAIGSLVQMGMQYVKNAIVAQSASAATTATQITEAAALAAAYQPAAMYASIATQGAAADIGAESYIAALGSMRAATIAGARKNGGSVLANNAYRVGEGGKPEILMQGGKQYLIPGENGRVLSNRQITSGKGGGSVINMTFNTPIHLDGNGGISEQDGQQLAKNIEQAIRVQIMKEQRPGGLLNRR